jgi:hypothetical protein
MNTYMVTAVFPPALSDEFLSIIPEQRAQVDKLLQNGTLRSYAVAKDRSFLWTIVVAGSEAEATAVVDAFPLRKFMTVRVTELLFASAPAAVLPQMSLN